MDERGVCPWAEQWSALVVLFRRFVLGLIPTFRCADFSRELWRELHGAASIGVACPRILLAVAGSLSSLHICMYSHGDCIGSLLLAL